jgi:serine/threonine-protein kinase
MDKESEAETLSNQIQKPLPSDPKIPPKLMAVIRKATEKDQTRRYQTALEFKTAIQNALLPDPPLSERISKFLQEHIIAIMLTLVGIALVIFFVILLTV